MAHRIPLWLPYLSEVNVSASGVIHYVYKGGEDSIRLKDISSIMIYGETDASFSFKTFEKISRAGIPVIYTRRNIGSPMIIHGGLRYDAVDTVTAQILARENKKKQCHIARQLLKAKMNSMKHLAPVFELPDNANINELRNIEAKHAKKYWREYYTYIGHPEWTRRGEETGKNPVSDTLNLTSKFICGIILRWTLYHHLSPSHGYFHVMTDYQSLVYDLIEPYRALFDIELIRLFKDNAHLEENWPGMAINLMKNKLNKKCYCPLTRQVVTYHELTHGIVLSLKSYLIGRQRKFHIPLPGSPNGGRPSKVEFKLYARNAGKTDFWKVAKEVADLDFACLSVG